MILDKHLVVILKSEIRESLLHRVINCLFELVGESSEGVYEEIK